MNVLTLVDTYPPAAGYAEQRMATGLAEGLADLGHTVHVIAADAGPGPHQRTRNGVTVHVSSDAWPFYHYDADSNAVLGSIETLGEALALVAAGGKPDVAICHGWPTILAGRVLCRRIGVPLVMYVHSVERFPTNEGSDDLAAYGREMQAWAVRAADAVVCPSEQVRAELAAAYSIPAGGIAVVAPACAAGRVGPGTTHLGDLRSLLAGDGELLVLFAGRLAPRNGAEILVRAVPAVLRRGISLRCVVTGEGDGAGAAMSLADESGVADRFVFTGHVSDRVLGSLYACCDILAAPGGRSASAIAAIESMALGTPVVGSDVGALGRLLVDGENGLKVTPDDPDSLAGAIVWLAGRRERLDRMGQAARCAAEERPSWSQSATAFADLSSRLAASRARNGTTTGS